MQITCNTSSAYHVQHAVCHLVQRGSSAEKLPDTQSKFIAQPRLARNKLRGKPVIEDPTCYLTLSQHTDTRPTSPTTDSIVPGVWVGSSHWPIFQSQWYNSAKTHGVTVSMSAFLACHQCYCVGSSLAWGLNLRAVVCGIFRSSSPGVFSGYSGFLPSFIGLMIQPTK